MNVVIVIPTYNEAKSILSTLKSLDFFSGKIVISDGGSTDDTEEKVRNYIRESKNENIIFRISSKKGRSAQMNEGAKIANSDVLLFLHADTKMTNQCLEELRGVMNDENVVGGAFSIRFTGRKFIFRCVEWWSNMRARLRKIYFGDQTIFIRSTAFKKIGGFPAVPLMEDIALSKEMKAIGKTKLLKSRVVSSLRRMEKNGVLKTIFYYNYLQILYFFGVSPERLAKIYGRMRKG